MFWVHGYPAASIADLSAATGLSRSSLYQRFQDKDGLFNEALARYIDRTLAVMDAVQAETVRGRMEALMLYFLPREGKRRRPPGCMLARCCSEMADLPEAGRTLARTGLSRQHGLIEALLRNAVSNGELPRNADTQALAWHFLGAIQALLNLPQAGASSAELRRMVDVAMSVWPRS